jgi:putative ABC transport system ATP-binding protein
MSLELLNVTKSYREPDGGKLPILDIPQFSIKQGEQVALIGSSGGGKTTLLNAIAGITTIDSGSIQIQNNDLTKMPEPTRDMFRALKIGYVFQTFNLLGAFTALENVLLGMSFGQQKVDRKFAREILEKMGLGHRLSHKPGQLSVGEQQRVAIARALVKQPAILLADEPTANVDPANQQNVLKQIRQACQEFDVSLLIVTHAMDVANLFDRVEQLSSFNKAGRPNS